MSNLQKHVNAAFESFVDNNKDENGQVVFRWFEAIQVFAEGYVNSMCDGALVSDDCLLSSIGFSRAFDALPDFLKHYGFNSNPETLNLEHEFKKEVFRIRNPQIWKTHAFIGARYDITVFENRVKNDPDFVAQAKKMEAIFYDMLEMHTA